jgi:hypothetical protein
MGHRAQRQQRHQAGEQPGEVADPLQVQEVRLFEGEDHGVGELALQLANGGAPIAGRIQAHEERHRDDRRGRAEASPQINVDDSSLAGSDRGHGQGRVVKEDTAHDPQPLGGPGGAGLGRVANVFGELAHGDAAQRDLVGLDRRATFNHRR